jgi:hypothetical protein
MRGSQRLQLAGHGLWPLRAWWDAISTVDYKARQAAAVPCASRRRDWRSDPALSQRTECMF